MANASGWMADWASWNSCSPASELSAPSQEPHLPKRRVDLMNWSLAEGEDNGKPLYIRFREEYRESGADSAYPRLIQIVWKYSADQNGLPTDEVIPSLKDFESRLIEAVEPEKVAVLVAVCTNNGEREWMLYAKSVSEFQARLDALDPDQQDPFPIDITSALDPKWSAFFDDTIGELA